MATQVTTSWRTLENVDVECTHCGVRMVRHVGSSQREKYFRCGSCGRQICSTYAADVLRADAKMRTRPVQPAGQVTAFDLAKSRLERFLSAVDEQDPYRVMGVRPSDTPERIRTRYRELALQCHPDRGGTPEKMRELNAAYERILRHAERREAQQPLPARLRTVALAAG